jgi:hypothetical protein
MSERISEILEVLNEIAKQYTPGMSATRITRLRIEAMQRVARSRSIEATTVSDKFRRQLRPSINGTPEFDKALYAWLNSGSNRLQVALESGAAPSDQPSIRSFFDIAATQVRLPRVVLEASIFNGGGESERHRCLKHYIATNPSLLGLPSGLVGVEEHPLPSGDRLDVFFHYAGQELAVEVKSGLSPEADLARGVFQCIKYEAVLAACQRASGASSSAKAILVTEGSLPSSVRDLKNILGVHVLEGIVPD